MSTSHRKARPFSSSVSTCTCLRAVRALPQRTKPPASQRRPSMLSCQDAAAGLHGKCSAESQPGRKPARRRVHSEGAGPRTHARSHPAPPPRATRHAPRAGRLHAGCPLPWQPSRSVFLRELLSAGGSRRPLPTAPQFSRGLRGGTTTKMAERSQTAPEAGLWGRSIRGKR